MKHCKGYSLIELLIVIAILALLLALGLPNLLHARANAQEASARLYATTVYKIAFAHILEPTNTLVEGDCKTSYVAGNLSAPGSIYVKSCLVKDAGDGTPEVIVETLAGTIFSLPQ